MSITMTCCDSNLMIHQEHTIATSLASFKGKHIPQCCDMPKKNWVNLTLWGPETIAELVNRTSIIRIYETLIRK